MNEKGLCRTLVQTLNLAKELAEMTVVATQPYAGNIDDPNSWTRQADRIRASLTDALADAERLNDEVM